MTQAADQAVFLDRDGTLIDDVGYPSRPEHVRLRPGVPDALTELRVGGLRLALVSNQSGIGRGLIAREEAAAVHEQLVAQLLAGGVELDGAYYCPHVPGDACGCRKPSAGMLIQAAGDLGLDLGRCFMVGDKATDIEAGARVGARTILLADGPPMGMGRPASLPDCVARTWPEVTTYILACVGEGT